MDIKANLLEEFINFNDLKKKQNTYFTKIMFLFVVPKSSILIFLSFK